MLHSCGLADEGASTRVPVRTARVRVIEGIPRLVVNDQPVPARIFWGAPGRGVVPAGPVGQEIKFEFTALEDGEGRATLHLRFGSLPGFIFLDSVRIVDTETGEKLFSCDFESDADFAANWSVWPPDERNTVGRVSWRSDAGKDGTGCLAVRLQEPRNGRWPDFHIYSRPTLPIVQGRHYRVSLWLKADLERKVIIAIYRPGNPFVFLGGPPGPFPSQVRLAAQAGVNLVSFPIPMPWPRPGEKPEWTAVDTVCREVLDSNPNALLIPRIPMDPPAWWIAAHPDHAMKWDQPGQDRVPASVASLLYREEAAARLRELVVHLEQVWGDHVAGYHPCGQNTGEWFYEDTWGTALSDYSPATAEAWQRWLKSKYATDEALQQAWDNRTVRLNSVDLPTPQRRRSQPSGLLHRPRSEQDLIDFAEFQQEVMAECVCHFARAVREASAGRKLVVFFYGYTFEFGAIRNGPATSGHYGLEKVLQSPDIDILCSPISYWDRGLGGSAPAMSAAESVMRAGKLWLFEDDTRTYLAKDSRFPGWIDGADTLADSQSLLLRNTAEVALRHFGTWWMDLGATGWFDDPQLWKVMRSLQPLDQAMLTRGPPFTPDVAAVVDEKSIMHAAFGSDAVTRPLIYEVRRPLGRMGTPYGQYLLSDVFKGNVSAKMLVFLAAWRLSKEERTQLRRATEGRLKVWCYAPGYLTGGEDPKTAMKELTGFEVEEVKDTKAWAEPTERGRKLGLSQGFGVKQEIRPLFAVTDANSDEVLATYPNGKAAVVLRRLPDGPSLFVGVPHLTSELLRLAARQAGVHLFTEEDANIYANGPFIALHAAHDGVLAIDVGTDTNVWDYVTGESLGKGPRLSLAMKKGETRILVCQERIVATATDGGGAEE
ncbi:beta-galactosidase [Thermogutta sp.]|uniref:beta-galactosidase n=1 Tax=Thermogutta sp. TaxID=1962930 RepID=UPI003C7BE3F4